ISIRNERTGRYKDGLDLDCIYFCLLYVLLQVTFPHSMMTTRVSSPSRYRVIVESLSLSLIFFCLCTILLSGVTVMRVLYFLPSGVVSSNSLSNSNSREVFLKVDSWAQTHLLPTCLISRVTLMLAAALRTMRPTPHSSMYSSKFSEVTESHRPTIF
ncbi:hypothetical protein PENTCL1PPCAC_22336, partial [Pristionchus entomophagus]